MTYAIKAPARYAQGAGELANLGRSAKKLGNKFLVICTDNSRGRFGAQVEASLAEQEKEVVFTTFHGEATKDEVFAKMDECRAQGCDVVVGMGGGKALQHDPNSEIARIPTDSWFVMVWVETGIVGVLLHISILLYILGRGAWLIFFRLKDKRLRGLTAGLLAGIAGIVVASYANEIFGQIPTGVIMYMSMSFVFLAPSYDRELAERRLESEASNAKRCRV